MAYRGQGVYDLIRSYIVRVSIWLSFAHRALRSGTLEGWDNEFRHQAFMKPNHRRTWSLSFARLVRNFARQSFEQNCV
jgi:hypothetical protein